jgi:hypothetical protein
MREDARVPTTFNNSIRAELRAIQGTRESKAKGQRLEALLARVLCSVRGMTLEAQDVESAYETEEIDLYFWNDRARDGLHFLDCPLIVECKAWSGPVSGRELRTFATLLSPCYSPYEVVATTLRTSNIYAYATPPAGWTAFQTISARRWGLIERVSTGALAPLLTLGVGSAHQSTRGTTRHPDNSRQTPA